LAVDFGYAGLARYTFLSLGFWVVLVAGIAFALVFAVGPTRGKRAARMWADACVTFVVLGAMADVIWALAIGEWHRFVAAYGYGPLAEMGVLALLFLGTMWFLAIRYTEGLKD
jgi:hypothetical protein